MQAGSADFREGVDFRFSAPQLRKRLVPPPDETQAFPSDGGDQLVAEFRDLLKRGEAPSIEEFVQRSDATGPELTQLISRLIAAEREHRAHQGEAIDQTEYASRFPAHLESVQTAFSARNSELETGPLDRTAAAKTRTTADPVSPASSPGDLKLAQYEIVRELGSGAFGMVYEARDTRLDRKVALKLLHRRRLSGSEAIERFMREAKAAGRLQHPNIVPVYEAGESEGVQFIASAMIQGVSLKEELSNRRKNNQPYSHRESAEIIRKLAAALHHAHGRGVVHRDVKPANVMVDSQGEPLVMDFGLARQEATDNLQTQQGDILGTPAYMSPEQARGDAFAADARSDLWSLGVMLFELLAKERPFQAQAPAELLLDIANKDAPSPRAIDRSIPIDLETIVLKCLEKDPERRYASCQHLADELARWLAGEPILERPLGAVERVYRWCRKRPLLTSATALAALLALAFLVYWNTRSAFLELRVQPTTAAVVIDGEPIDLNDGEVLLPLAPGRREVSVSLQNYESQTQVVELMRGAANTVTLKVKLLSRLGRLKVDSEPVGASVEIVNSHGDVAASGRTPYLSDPIEAGAYRVRVAKRLYEPEAFSVQSIGGDQTRTVPVVRLTPIEKWKSHIALAELKDLLNQPIATQWSFQSQPLEAVLRTIESSQGVAFTFDEPALKSIGVNRQTPISYQRTTGSLLDNLTLMLRGAGLSFAVDSLGAAEQSLRVTSLVKANSEYVFIVHALPEMAPGEGANSSLIAADITQQINAASWAKQGGKGEISADAKEGTLSVTHSLQTQLQIAEYLENPLDRALLPDLKRLTAYLDRYHGMATPDFALALQIPESEFEAFNSALLSNSLMLTRLRPWYYQKALYVAAIWERNRQPVRFALKLTQDEMKAKNQEMERAFYYPIDVAFHKTNNELRTAAVWRNAPEGERTQMKFYAGSDEEKESQDFKDQHYALAVARTFENGKFFKAFVWRPNLRDFFWRYQYDVQPSYEQYRKTYTHMRQLDTQLHYIGGQLYFTTAWKQRTESEHSLAQTILPLAEQRNSWKETTRQNPLLRPCAVSVRSNNDQEPVSAVVWNQRFAVD